MVQFVPGQVASIPSTFVFHCCPALHHYHMKIVHGSDLWNVQDKSSATALPQFVIQKYLTIHTFLADSTRIRKCKIKSALELISGFYLPIVNQVIVPVQWTCMLNYLIQ